MECHRTHEAKQIPMRSTLWVRWQYCPSPQSFFEKCNFPYKEMSQAFTRRHSLIRRIIKRSRCLGLPHWWVCVPESRSICPSRFLTVVRCFIWILPSQLASPAPPSSQASSCSLSGEMRGWLLAYGFTVALQRWLNIFWNSFHFIMLKIYKAAIMKDSIFVL